MRGRRALAAAFLAVALLPPAAMADGDPVAIEELLRSARMWQSLDRPDNARRALVKILAVDADQPRALLMLAELELRAGKPGEAQRLLQRLQRSGPPGEVAELQDLLRLYTRDAPRLAQLRLLRRGGNDARARALAQELFPGGRAPGLLAAEFAPLLSSRSAAAPAPPRAAAAAAAARRTPAAQPGPVAAALDVAALRREAEAEVAQDRPSAALRLLEGGLAQAPRDPWLRHDLARLYAALAQPLLGRAVIDEGLALVPADPDMHYAAALFHAAVGDDALALAELEAVPPAARSEGQLAFAARLQAAQSRRADEALVQLADAAAREAAQERALQDAAAARESLRQPTDELALFPLVRHAAAGRSTLVGAELPLVLTRPFGDDGHGFLHVDGVRLSAGNLPAAQAEAAEFGRVQSTGSGLAADLPQRARGLSVGVGWNGDGRRWDAGVIGAGFDVPNLVGGFRQAFTLAGNDASVEVSRRVLTGSLLSYAGSTDPVSGQRWGGVTLNALTLRLGGTLDSWTASASLRAGLLRGRNVAANDTLQLRLAADRDLTLANQTVLNAGVALSVWRYRENLGFFSFGQGGYYSPQRYTSLALPLELQGSGNPWRYRVRATVARSWTYEADSPYYPTDPVLQAAAGNPVHAGGGSGGGWSGSLRADLERRLDDHWSAGASLIADRSAYYAPTQVLLYLRRAHKPQSEAASLPRPLQPYSQF